MFYTELMDADDMVCFIFHTFQNSQSHNVRRRQCRYRPTHAHGHHVGMLPEVA
jgi:hypothetical protein